MFKNYISSRDLEYANSISWITVGLRDDTVINEHVTMWLLDNVQGKWRLFNRKSIGFTHGEDALAFRLNFNL